MQRARASVVVIAIVVAWVGTAGCSFLAVDGPPPVQARGGPFQCTTSVAMPVVDYLAAGLVAVHELGGVGNPDREWTGTSLSDGHARTLSFVVMAGLVASAAYGTERIGACREALDAKSARGSASPR